VRLVLKRNSGAEDFFKSQVKSVFSVDAMQANSGPMIGQLGCDGITCICSCKTHTYVYFVDSDWSVLISFCPSVT